MGPRGWRADPIRQNAVLTQRRSVKLLDSLNASVLRALAEVFRHPAAKPAPGAVRVAGERRDPGVPSKTIDSYGSSGGATFGMPAINEAGTISFNSSTENIPSSVYL
jgi:hypothetical protein